VNGRLRDGLPVSDGERRVLISAVANSGGDEEVTRGFIYSVKDSQVFETLLVQHFDKSPPRTPELVL
jgi:hypothetical protein